MVRLSCLTNINNVINELPTLSGIAFGTYENDIRDTVILPHEFINSTCSSSVEDLRNELRNELEQIKSALRSLIDAVHHCSSKKELDSEIAELEKILDAKNF